MQHVPLSETSTTDLARQIYANAAVQRRNPPDSAAATAARRANRPLLAEMATRPDAPPVR
jgi:hypothetical protein